MTSHLLYSNTRICTTSLINAVFFSASPFSFFILQVCFMVFIVYVALITFCSPYPFPSSVVMFIPTIIYPLGFFYSLSSSFLNPIVFNIKSLNWSFLLKDITTYLMSCFTNRSRIAAIFSPYFILFILVTDYYDLLFRLDWGSANLVKGPSSNY